MKKIRVGIVGAAGYTGGELIRLLIFHPAAEIVFAHSRSQAGKPVASVHTDLTGETPLQFTRDLALHKKDIDVLFLCLGHGESLAFLQQHQPHDEVAIIDLAHDFRLKENASFQHRKFIYGLPELNRDEIRKSKNVANPGCFATAIQLSLLPLAKAGKLSQVYTTAITGSTGAGQTLSETSHFSWRYGNIQAYKTLTHQHLGEIHQSLHQLQPGLPLQNVVHFIPWRGNFTRGIFAGSQLKTEENAEQLYELYRSYYASHPFTLVCHEPVSLKQVINTNKCLIQLEKKDDQLVIHAAIDNLLKGASGQAVQNMNLMFGLEETTGLKLKPVGF
ncbi:MAG: N-acetyl-gamma-glutamyl-phosphate reductase [Chitinophagaceae bacterium]|nr:N-acetyl-gamma-glutamyl-phosphate reductase [Chitinophagaceae bacterium]